MRADHDKKKQAANSALTDLLIDYEQEIARIRADMDEHRAAINELTVQLDRIIDLHNNLTASREGLSDAQMV